MTEKQGFRGDVSLVTRNGVVRFNDLADGQKVTVLDMDGIWRDAVIRCYGDQKIFGICISNGNINKVVHCTRNKNWILSNGNNTSRIEVGDKLYPLSTIAKPNNVTGDRAVEMFAFGFVLVKGEDDPGKNYKNNLIVNLDGTDSDFEDVFKRAGYSIRTSENGDVFATKKSEMCRSWFLDSHGWFYLSPEDKENLFEGVLSALGTSISQDGVSQYYVVTDDCRILQLILDISAISGYHISKIHTNNQQSNIEYSVSFMLSQGGNSLWKVTDIKPFPECMYESPVWCVEEPVTHSFTLDGGIIVASE